MTKKHFEALAAALKATNASRETCIEVMNVCRANHRGGGYSFDKDRFMRACGH